MRENDGDKETMNKSELIKVLRNQGAEYRKKAREITYLISQVKVSSTDEVAESYLRRFARFNNPELEKALNRVEGGNN